ncbi:XRE family transcriptional regulator [Rheinheimera sp. YQF-2]|uniref:XRE family transcriptional regulator n=1 Tax=Rheinheimera lutimaris TaxID=2740584 RepID=A0A7Y5ELQ5_9GAMM|nr:XRE family transcriptional regulator [Rheinheimera lutimaris]NRQ43438.1 XRE family transcriptional regulator [Rheinheimera lutimaris]
MALTEFGKEVRKARIDTDQTLMTMAAALRTTPAFLSAMETGSKKIAQKWVDAIYSFFAEKGLDLANLQELANAANDIVPVEGLTHQQKMLVAGFAKSQWTPEQLKQFANLLEHINKQEGNSTNVSTKRSARSCNP